MQHSTLQCSMMYNDTVQFSALQCSAVQCSVVQGGTMQCSTGQCSKVQCSTVLCHLVDTLLGLGWLSPRMDILKDGYPEGWIS